MIDDLMCDIMTTCVHHDLNFWYSHHVKMLEIRKVTILTHDILSDVISEGYIEGSDGNKESTLNRMLQEVNEFLEGRKWTSQNQLLK